MNRNRGEVAAELHAQTAQHERCIASGRLRGEERDRKVTIGVHHLVVGKAALVTFLLIAWLDAF